MAALDADQRLGAFGEQLVEHSRGLPPTAWWSEVVTSGAVQAIMQRLMRGEITADKAAASVQSVGQNAVG